MHQNLLGVVCKQTNFEGRCARKEEIDDVEMKILTGLKILNYVYKSTDRNVLQLQSEEDGRTLFNKIMSFLMLEIYSFFYSSQYLTVLGVFKTSPSLLFSQSSTTQ